MRDDLDRFRPAFHFTPESRWMNDPNGLVFAGGVYHLFYQYFPGDVVWGPMHWGHATSRDLVSWERQPVALYPDEAGWIFSGSAVVDETGSAGFGANAVVAAFTVHDGEARKRGRVDVENQGLAYSADGGATWVKYGGNPVLRNSGEADFRDPKVFRGPGGRWNLALAAGDRIKIYSSENLRDWRQESDFFPAADGFGVWECPDLFPMATGNTTRWVMLLSQTQAAPHGGSGTRYLVGDFDGCRFTPLAPLDWVDWGEDFYAAATWSAEPGEKRIILAWMSNWQYAAKTPTGSWRGAMTLPRELTLAESSGAFSLVSRPCAGFERLARETLLDRRQALPFGVSGIALDRADVTVAIPESPRPFAVTLSNANGERFSLRFDGVDAFVDRTRSGDVAFSPDFAPSIQATRGIGPVSSLRLVVDACSIEAFIDGGRRTITNLAFPSEPYSSIEITGKGIASLTIARL